MRYTAIFATAIVLAVPSLSVAQYDFDDFLNAVAAGQNAASQSNVRLAQAADTDAVGSGAARLDQPVQLEMLESTETLPVPAPAPSMDSQTHVSMSPPVATPVPAQVNFDEMFIEQDAHSAASAQTACHGGTQCDGRHGRSECAPLPYQEPNLPAPSSLRGYFRASPCVANVWDGYSCEAARDCAKLQSALVPPVGKSGHCKCSNGSCP